MVKVGGKEVNWEKAPNFVNNVQRKILWRDEETGATFAILRIPKGVLVDDIPHNHPNANQFTFRLSGEAEFPDGSRLSLPEDEYDFNFCPKGGMHGTLSKRTKILKDIIYIHYWDGPDEWDDTDTIDQ